MPCHFANNFNKFTSLFNYSWLLPATKHLCRTQDQLRISPRISLALWGCPTYLRSPRVRDMTSFMSTRSTGKLARARGSLTSSSRKIYRCASLSCFTRNLTRFSTPDASTRAHATEFTLYNTADRAIKHRRRWHFSDSRCATRLIFHMRQHRRPVHSA